MNNPFEDVAAAVHSAIEEQGQVADLPFALTPQNAVREPRQAPLFSAREADPCETCHGRGRLAGGVCRDCLGTGSAALARRRASANQAEQPRNS